MNDTKEKENIMRKKIIECLGRYVGRLMSELGSLATYSFRVWVAVTAMNAIEGDRNNLRQAINSTIRVW